MSLTRKIWQELSTEGVRNQQTDWKNDHFLTLLSAHSLLQWHTPKCVVWLYVPTLCTHQICLASIFSVSWTFNIYFHHLHGYSPVSVHIHIFESLKTLQQWLNCIHEIWYYQVLECSKLLCWHFKDDFILNAGTQQEIIPRQKFLYKSE